MLISRGMGRVPMYVSGSISAESATDPTLADALKAMTIAHYGRDGQKVDLDDALNTAIRVTKQQQSAHSYLSELTGRFVGSLVEMRKKVWA